MMKYFFSIIICLGFSIGLYGQYPRVEGDLPPQKVSPQDTLDFSKMRVQYQIRMMKDTLHPEKITEDQIILQIGLKISKSFNYFQMINDSILRQELISGMDINERLKNSRGRRQSDLMLKYSIFKNYPAGKITTLDNIFTDRYYFEEDIPDFQWKLEKGEQEVLGYLCKKATLNFRGRTYEAWYAPEIPISDGPWKFSGLPGLILKISDAKNQYAFEVIALSGVSWRDPVTMRRSLYIKTTRENFNTAVKRHWNNPAATIQNSDKIIAPPETSAKVKARPYNPIELE